jgi:hypothetical protein
MKVRKLVPLFVVCFLSVACEEKNEGGEAETAPAAEGANKEAAAKAADTNAQPAAAAPAPVPVAAKEPPAPGPQDICVALAGAAKTKDEAKVLASSSAATATALAAEGAKEHLMAALAPVTCGVAKVDGETAVVPLTGGEVPYEATFAKAADGWKFDGVAFLAKYPPAKAAKAAKGKKGAAAHEKAGKKAHGKHKGH